MNLILIVAAALGFIAGFLFCWVTRQRIGQAKLANATEVAEQCIADAKAEGETIKKEKLLEAKEEIFNRRQKLEQQSKNKLKEIQRLEQQLGNREMDLDRKVDVLSKKEEGINQLSGELNQRKETQMKLQAELDRLIQEENRKLEQISGLTTEEAKKIQMSNILEIAREDTAQEVAEIRASAQSTANREAKEVVLHALQRNNLSHIVDTTVSILKLPDDEMKGRIIGREGRNIRAFENTTGIEVLIDDTPQTVVLSCFDPIRREIAKQSLEKLIYDGRIHPGRIEEVVQKSTEEVAEQMFERGEQTIQDLGLHGIHNELVRLLGRQHFRTNYGQNLLQHSKEVASLAGDMAAQLGLDIKLAKRAGLLHDIGKTADDYGDAPFYEIGVELAKKYGENERVQNAIAAQAPFESETEVNSPITILVKLANSISVSRPGAQKESLDNYIKRMGQLEEIAKSFPGVVNSFAIQAGRELRVIVEHSVIDDDKAQLLADDLVKKLRDEMEFPGQIKVTVIREFRSVDYAK